MTTTVVDPATPQEVTPVETFFDLVYVFAISQLAQHLSEHLTWRGAAQTLLLLVAVFTIWSFTTLESTMVLARAASAQRVILGVMVLGLVMNASIPRAFSDSPWSFVVPMLVIQVGRSLATSRVDVVPVLRRHRFAMAVWALVSAIPWCMGALSAQPDHRLEWWLLAVVIDLVGAISRHPIPGFRQDGLDEIRFDIAHQVERTRLFLLICFGEAIVRVGEGIAAAPQDLAHLAAGITAMLSLIFVWLLFFGNSKGYADRWFARGDRASESRLGRLATYGQQFLVIAFVAHAVGTELAVEEPREALGAVGLALLFGGMTLCLVSYAIFLRRLTGRRHWPELAIAAVLTVAVGGLLDLVNAPALVSTTVLAAIMGAAAWWHNRGISRIGSSAASPVGA